MSLVETDAPSFPPLLRGQRVPGSQEPFAKAVAAAGLGCDPGTVFWSTEGGRLSAALVLAPEVPLSRAISVSFAMALGLGDALGALAPPEVAVHYDWPGGFRVNGARCGEMRAAASTADTEAEPDWLVLAVEIPFLPEGEDPGRDPERTCLVEEGCGEIAPLELLESFARHTLVWIDTWQRDGLGPLHEQWRARAWGLGEDLPGGGRFMGLDEWGGRLVRAHDSTRLDPLTLLLER